MVFSSLPGLYLDPPNWQPQLGTGGDNSHQLTPVVPPPPPVVEGGSRPNLIRPGSMTDRARLAKLQQPETALKCPRCDSINTKFCYFNNYNLSQPRHFCKTCRRYWTRGGALRNVPVGGGCRRNKRTKGGSSGSKSPVASTDHSNNSTTPVSSYSCSTEFIPHITPHQPPQLPFLPSLHHDYRAGDIGFSFASGSAGADVEVPVVGGGRFIEQWRLQQFQQFPFWAGLEPTAGIYQFENENNVEPRSYIGAATGVSQLGVVKSEENQGGVNLSRNILGRQTQGNDEYWGGNINAWTTDLNGFAPSTTSQLL